MARLGSQRIAGYYPAPTHLLPAIARTLDIAEPEGANRYLRPRPEVLDPCAGKGEALAAFGRAWKAQRIHACELEIERHAALLRICPEALQGDGTRLAWRAEDGVDVLWLNPPYDHDPETGRLEERFLRHLHRAIRPGGFLLFLIPGTALAASVSTLVNHFDEIDAWRLPDGDFEVFGQLLIRARKRAAPFFDTKEEARLRALVPTELPTLDQATPAQLVPGGNRHRTHFLPCLTTLDPLEVETALADWTPFDIGERPLEELLSPRFETAAPPRPVHTVLAIAAGALEGRRLCPDDPRDPELLVSGSFTLDERQVGVTQDDHGKITARTFIDTPNLRCTVFDLRAHAFHTLKPGSEPSGSSNLAEWTLGDLFGRYETSLLRHLEEAFPVLHDPRREDHALELPRFDREPFFYQRTSIVTALKILASGQHQPKLYADVGTGKTTMSLLVAGALFPDHREATVRQLEAQGLAGARDLPTVRRLLVLLPPHLVTGWKNDLRAIFGKGVNIHVLDSITAVERAAKDPGPSIALLTTSKAKLSSTYRGLVARIDPKTTKSLVTCPACGVLYEATSKELAARRQRCRIRHAVPSNRAAQLARRLAEALLPYHSADTVLRRLAPRASVQRRHRVKGGPCPSEARGHARALHQLARGFVERALDDPREGDSEALRPALDLLFLTQNIQDGARQTFESLRDRLLEAHPGTFDAELYAYRYRRAPSGAQHLVEVAIDVLHQLDSVAEWRQVPCAEPLFTLTAKPLDGPRTDTQYGPRRVPLAQHIARRHPRAFDFVIFDECHEHKHQGSARSQAAQRLAQMGARSLWLTGTAMNGYASSLWVITHLSSPRFREHFGRGERSSFLAQYGLRKWTQLETTEENRGTQSDRRTGGASVREYPGIHPDFLTRYALADSLFVFKADLDAELPKKTETTLPLALDLQDPFDAVIDRSYHAIQDQLLGRVRQDLATVGKSKMLGALCHWRTYLDRATDDLPEYRITEKVDEVDGQEVRQLFDRGAQVPAEHRTPKELLLLHTLEGILARGEKLLLLTTNTGDGSLPGRLLRIVRELTDRPERATWLDSAKVDTQGRENWIRGQLARHDLQVLVVHPKAIETGLNCLTDFTHIWWHQLPDDPALIVQANGRAHRLGQTRDVRIYYPFYVSTAQETALDLTDAKLQVMAQFQGVDMESGLVAFGGKADDEEIVDVTLSLGAALYEEMSGSGARRRERSLATAAVQGRETLVARPVGNAPTLAEEPVTALPEPEAKAEAPSSVPTKPRASAPRRRKRRRRRIHEGQMLLPFTLPTAPAAESQVGVA